LNPRLLPSKYAAELAHAKRRFKCYKVNASVLKALKREVNESADGTYVTTNDHIYAHMWTSVSSWPITVNEGKDIGIASVVKGGDRFYRHPLPILLDNVWTFMTLPRILTADLLKMFVLDTIASKIPEKLLSVGRETWLPPETRTEFVSIITDKIIIPWAKLC
jgi:hypothetical protein